MRAVDGKQEINLEWPKATPNKFPVSRPELMQNSMRAGGPFPLFHYFLNGSEPLKALVSS